MINLIVTENQQSMPDGNRQSMPDENQQSMPDGSQQSIPDKNLLEIMQNAALLASAKERLLPENLDIEISLSFVTEEEIREYNKAWRGIDSVTDVLSFPQFDFGGLTEADLKLFELSRETSQIVNIGDIVICIKRAMAQAEEYGHSLERELTYLFVHSVLHLFGHDHNDKESKDKMRSKEKTIMNELEMAR